MSSPTSLTSCCLYTLKSIWKIHHACLTSLEFACCALWSSALISTSFHVSLEIQDARTFVGRGIFETPPVRTAKAAPSLV